MAMESRSTGRIERGLSRVRSRARALLILRASCLVLAAAVLVMVGIGMLDYALRFPGAMRIGFLGALAAGVMLGVIRYVVPAARFKPPLREIALRLERSEAGRSAGLSGVLASGLELDSAAPRTPVESALAKEVATRAAGLWSPRLVGAIITPRVSARAAGVLALAVAIAVAPAFVWPGLVSTAARRVLTPWTDAKWPTRTLIVDATGATVHAADRSLALRGVLVRTNRREGQTRVLAQYRVLTPDGAGGESAGPLQTVVLTSQERVAAAPEGEGGDAALSGELFERLLEPGAMVSAAPTGEATLEYWLRTDDSRTEPTRVLVVRPPSVAGASVRIEPPAYAAEALAALEPERAGATHTLSPPTGGTMPTPLVGSRVTMTIDHSKSIPAPSPGEAGYSGFLRRSLGVDALPDGLQADLSGARWTLSWTLAGPTTFRVSLTDEHGVESTDEAVLSIDAASDAEPLAAVVEPAQDEAVLATAALEIVGEGRDDVAIRDTSLEFVIAKPPVESSGVGAEPGATPAMVTGPDTPSSFTRVNRSVHGLDLATMGVKGGDEVWVTAVATDGYEFAGATHEPARSTPRRLRVITEPEMVEQLRAELQSVRQAAIRLDAEQAELSRAVRSEPPPRDLAERQAALGERIASQRETVQRLVSRTQRNNLSDESLAGLLDDAESFVSGAAGASQEATERIQSAAGRSPGDPEAGAADEQARIEPEEQRQIEEAQDKVRDELGQLVRLLDNGQDAWVARRSVERLLADQRRLLEETMAMAGRTTGRSLDQLSQDERSELERIAERQSEAARQAEGALDELSERSRDLKDADAAQAQAMALATQRGRTSNVGPKLDEAARQISQNQANAASQRQQEAIQTLEEMLEDLDSAERRRDESLRRQLSSIIESIESLIAQQDGQITLLTRARGGGSREGLESGMIRVSQNTLGVVDQITAAGQQMEQVGNMVLAAATAQSNAIAALREPADLEGADTAERLSGARLRDAKAEAERLDKEAAERDAGRKRKELRAAYRDALEQQRDLLGRSTPLAGRELDRRERAGVRQAGEQQDALRAAMDDLRAKTEELADAQVFAFAHDRMHDAMTASAAALREARVDRALIRNQEGSARVLQSLLAALADPKDERDFREETSGGSGSGGQGQGQGSERLIPDLAKLRLLREMQQFVLESTRAAADDPASYTAEDLDALGALQRQLAEQGRALVEQMMQPEQSLPPEGGARPTGEEGP